MPAAYSGLLQKVADLLRSRAELERKYGESLLGFGADIQVEPGHHVQLLAMLKAIALSVCSGGNPLHSAVDAMIAAWQQYPELHGLNDRKPFSSSKAQK